MISTKTIAGLKQSKGYDTKFRVAGYYRPLNIQVEAGRLLFDYDFDEELTAVIKTRFEDRRYHGFIAGDERKIWSAPISFRNLFQLEALQGKYGIDPYVRWSNIKDREAEIKQYCHVDRHARIQDILLTRSKIKDGKIYGHQVEMVNFMVNVMWFLCDAEMGTGKTLATIIAVEMLDIFQYPNAIWCGPRSALAQAKLEFEFWESKWLPRYFTYNGLVKEVGQWSGGAPRIAVFDEGSNLSGHTSQRSDAAQYLTDNMRKEWGNECFIVDLTGTPAAKNPSKWWKQAEILCPGFVAEASWYAFRERIGFLRKEKSGAEGAGEFNKLFGWRDSELKCKWCGEVAEHVNHRELSDEEICTGPTSEEEQIYERHDFEAGKNEVANIATRLEGLKHTWLKSECTDLPPKQFKVIELTPTNEVMNAAKSAAESASRGADALMKCRTISDGFFYQEEVIEGEFKDCPGCHGVCKVDEYYDKDEGTRLSDDEAKDGVRYVFEECPEDEDLNEFVPKRVGEKAVTVEKRKVDCYTCAGKGIVPKTERAVIEVPCPKVDLFIDLLGRHEEVGRFVTYAGFQGSIDRLQRTALQQNWSVIKADGRGWSFSDPASKYAVHKFTDVEMLKIFQQQFDEYPHVLFLGQPGAAGMGLNLTASPTIFFYSNDFQPVSRLQAEDRGHRLGMGDNFWIIDAIHLPTDRKVLESLQQSRDLQRMSQKGVLSILEKAA